MIPKPLALVAVFVIAVSALVGCDCTRGCACGSSKVPCAGCSSDCLRKFPDDPTAYEACLSDCYGGCQGARPTAEMIRQQAAQHPKRARPPTDGSGQPAKP